MPYSGKAHSSGLVPLIKVGDAVNLVGMVANNLTQDSGSKTTVFIVEDQNLYLEGLRQFIEHYPEFEVVGTARAANQALVQIAKIKPAIVIIDIFLPDMSGLELLRQLKKKSASTKALILSEAHEENVINELVESGADSYVLKSESNIEIYKSLSSLACGKPYYSPRAGFKFFSALKNHLQEHENNSVNTVSASLTKREQQIAEYLKAGLTNKEIASELGCSAFTVKCHKANLMRKIHVNSSSEIVQWFSRSKT